MDEQKKLEQEKVEKWIAEVKKACENPLVRASGRWIDKSEEESIESQIANNPQIPVFKILYVSLAFMFLIVIIVVSKQGWLAPKISINNTITNPSGDIIVNTPEVKPEVNVNLNNTINIPNEIKLKQENYTVS